MEICVFDHHGNVVKIKLGDIIDTTKIDNRLRYITRTGTFFGPRNIKEEALLYEEFGFVCIDTNIVVNMKFIERLTSYGVVVNGVNYPMSRRKLADLKRKMRKFIPLSQ